MREACSWLDRQTAQVQLIFAITADGYFLCGSIYKKR